MLHGPANNPEIQRLAPNMSATESHLLGVCSATDAERNGVLFGLSPAATVDSGGVVPAVVVVVARLSPCRPHRTRPTRPTRRCPVDRAVQVT